MKIIIKGLRFVTFRFLDCVCRKLFFAVPYFALECFFVMTERRRSSKDRYDVSLEEDWKF